MLPAVMKDLYFLEDQIRIQPFCPIVFRDFDNVAKFACLQVNLSGENVDAQPWINCISISAIPNPTSTPNAGFKGKFATAPGSLQTCSNTRAKVVTVQQPCIVSFLYHILKKLGYLPDSPIYKFVNNYFKWNYVEFCV